MIGDEHRTVARILEGYRFVNQLVKHARFSPGDSERRGRGSNPDYPFSWVYTALGYGPIREWLGLEDLAKRGRRKQPIQQPSKFKDAGELMILLFGNRSRSRRAAISDSRQIGQLAQAIAEPESRRLLMRGKTIEEVSQLLKPARERVSDSLFDAQDALGNALQPLSQGELGEKEAAELVTPSNKVQKLAGEVRDKIISIAFPSERKSKNAKPSRNQPTLRDER